MLNSKGEVVDCLDVSQFIGGHSAYECVAYSAALLKYAGQPGHGPTGTVLEASNLAQYWYGKLEGSNASSNTNGMSLNDEYIMLKGIGLSYEPLPATIEAIKTALGSGRPILFCGAETGMHDLALGDRVPYSWPPSGNHAIVISGIAPDGNLLVHDCASIAPGGVRPGPRVYDAAKMQPVSATAINVPWLAGGEDMQILISTPGVSNYYKEVDAHHWECIVDGTSKGKIIQYGILAVYKSLGQAGATDLRGLTWLGLPLTNETPLDADGNVRQYFERGCLIYNPKTGKTRYDNPPGAGDIYTAHVYGESALGQDPHIPLLQQQITALQDQLKAALTTGSQSAAFRQIQTIIAPFL
jgi:hypothetical protein